MLKQDLVEYLEKTKNQRRDFEIYANYVMVQKFLWKKLYLLIRNMVFSTIADISARIERASRQYNALLDLMQEVQDVSEHDILTNIQYNQIYLKIEEMKDEIEQLVQMPKLREGLEFYDKL